MCRYAALDRIPIFFVLPKRKRPFMVKRKGAGDELAPKGPSHPKCGARRHGLLCKPRTPLLAAPMAVLCRTAFPHLKARHSPGCKPERLSATPPCVPLRYALPGLLRIGSHPSSNSGGNPKGRDRSPSPLCRFKGVRRCSSGEAPPGADNASRFRGNGTIGGLSRPGTVMP